jgi:hypothetical protein
MTLTAAPPATAASVCLPPERSALERVRYFPRQLITPTELTQEQDYFRARLRRHNRMLHGWGIVCGACVRVADPKMPTCSVVVETGYVLGPFGDEIVIADEVPIDICAEDLDGNATSGCGGGGDPWCRDVRVDRRSDQDLYIAIRYDECESRPIRVDPAGCGCGDDACEYSRIRDGFALRVLTELPDSYVSPELIGKSGLFECDDKLGGPDCPVCPNEPWVILGVVTLDASKNIATLDCSRFRRYAASFGNFAFSCASLAPPIGVRPFPWVTIRDPLGRFGRLEFNVDVKPGDTFGSLIEREGDRRLRDVATGATYSLRDLYALAHVKPEDAVTTPGDAILPLEGLVVRADDARTVRDSLSGILSADALMAVDREHGGALDATPEVPSADLTAAGGHPGLADNLVNLSVGDVAKLDRTAFVKTATKGIKASERPAAEAAAAATWADASRVVAIVDAWKGSVG